LNDPGYAVPSTNEAGSTDLGTAGCAFTGTGAASSTADRTALGNALETYNGNTPITEEAS
jgi:hypothetical protein